MPCVDMPLKDLYKYNGTNPKPNDFDEYWERALKEADAVNVATEFVPRKFKARGVKFYDIYFTGTKGARVHAKFALPTEVVGKMPAVLWFHGLDGSAQPWSDLMIYASQGMAVAYMDVRGQGGLSEDVGGVKGITSVTPFVRGLDDDADNLLMREVFLDTYILSKIVMEHECIDENRVGVMGGSQGGALSIVCAALNPKIKKCAVSVPYLSDYKRVWEMDLAQAAYAGLKSYFRNFDPTHERENEIFEKLGYIDIQNLAPRINADFIMATGLMDTICPPSTQFAMYNKLNTTKKVIIYPDYGHENLKNYNDTTFEFMCSMC